MLKCWCIYCYKTRRSLFYISVLVWCVFWYFLFISTINCYQSGQSLPEAFAEPTTNSGLNITNYPNLTTDELSHPPPPTIYRWNVYTNVPLVWLLANIDFSVTTSDQIKYPNLSGNGKSIRAQAIESCSRDIARVLQYSDVEDVDCLARSGDVVTSIGLMRTLLGEGVRRGYLGHTIQNCSPILHLSSPPAKYSSTTFL